VPAERELGLDPILELGRVELLEAADLMAGEFVVGELDERRAAPERERGGELGGGFGRVDLECALSLVGESLAAAEIAPEAIDQLLGRNDLIRAQQEEGEQRLLLAAGQQQHAGARPDLEGSE
jgi:hypothetical protein